MFLKIFHHPELEKGICDLCRNEILVFGRRVAHAKFLMVRLADRPSLGGGKCPHCRKDVCLACATKTVYGAGMRRLHCPECGRFLVGLRREPEEQGAEGEFLEEPPPFVVSLTSDGDIKPRGDADVDATSE